MSDDGIVVGRETTRRLRFLTLALSAIAASALFVMMALTFVDVVGRYFLAAPIRGAFEIIEFLLALVIFSGLPLVTLANAHISVGIVDGILGRRVQRWKQAVVFVGSAVANAFIADRMWSQARDIADAGLVSGSLKLEIAPIVYAMAALAAVSSLLQLVMVWECLRGKPGRTAPGDGRTV